MEKNSISTQLQNKGGRKKGCIPWNKGIPRTDEVKRKISESRKGKIFPHQLENLKKGWGWGKGKKRSPEFCRKISEATKGRKAHNKKPDTVCIVCGKKLSRHCYTKCSSCYLVDNKERLRRGKGRKVSEETKKMRKPHPWNQGSKHRSWKGGVTPKHEKIRKSRQYKRWRAEVFRRDNYTCQNCGVVGGKIEAHHIKSFSEHSRLRMKISNGVTYCIECHKIIDYLRR